LGYIFGKSTSKLANVKVNMPLLLLASVLPDIDLILRFMMHRGPTHSLIAITVLMIPFFVVYRKQAIPYYAALLSHIFIGDFIGGVEMFWPISHSWFGALNLESVSQPNAIAEFALFCLTLPIMYKLGDLKTLVKSSSKKWALIVPLVAVLVPLLAVGRGYESALPALLVVPSLFYLGLFAYALIVDLVGKHPR
jgi:membrane-bound metal-dependent hydrolase YbcI (DUF457 family)